MNIRTAILLSVTGAALGMVWYNWQNSSMDKQYRSSSIEHEYTYQCQACKAEFSMDRDRLEKLVKQGKTIAPEHELRRFPCTECGEVTAVLKEQKYAPAKPSN